MEGGGDELPNMLIGIRQLPLKQSQSHLEYLGNIPSQNHHTTRETDSINVKASNLRSW